MTTDPTPDPAPGDSAKYVTEEQLTNKFDEFFERLKSLGITSDDVVVDDDDDDDDDTPGVTMKEIEEYFEKKTQEIIATLKPKRSAKTIKNAEPTPTPTPTPEPLPREANHKTLQEHLRRAIFGKTDETVS